MLPGPATQSLNRLASRTSRSRPRRLLRLLPFLVIVPVVLWLLSPYDTSFRLFPLGPPPGPPPPPPPLDLSDEWGQRANEVREAFIHAYEGYRRHAFGADELLPLTGGKVNNFNGWGLTMVDSLDTMFIMDLRHFFDEAVDHISTVSFNTPRFVPFFETTIRYLGGLLSAHALSNHPVLLQKADQLGDALLPAFNTTSGFPWFAVDTQSGKTRQGWTHLTLWAEAASCQLEFKYLAHLTKRREYHDKVQNIMRVMHNYTQSLHPAARGVFPTMWEASTGLPQNTQFSVGAYADSALEYLLKQYLMTGMKEDIIGEMYKQSISQVLDQLLYVTPTREMVYVTDTTFSSFKTAILHGVPSHKLEHLSCFLPGLIALGAHSLSNNATTGLSDDERSTHLLASQALAYTCYSTYADSPSGLGADEMSMTPTSANPSATTGRWIEALTTWRESPSTSRSQVPPGLTEYPPDTSSDISSSTTRDYAVSWGGGGNSYLLRPETVESLYMLWRVTRDNKWRERGWKIFEAIQKHCKTPYGYASVSSVTAVTKGKLDLAWKRPEEMPSFFLAETLKYLYLLFLPLETNERMFPFPTAGKPNAKAWVFNTEAHPLPVFESEWL